MSRIFRVSTRLALCAALAFAQTALLSPAQQDDSDKRFSPSFGGRRLALASATNPIPGNRSSTP